MVEHEDAFFTFSDEDFERRYASDETEPRGGASLRKSPGYDAI